jgi:hypothetical protein
MFKLIKTSFVYAAVAFFAGCGGGGDSAPPAVTNFPIQSALTYAYTNGLQSTLNVTGSASDGTYTVPITGFLTFTIGKATSTTFNGTAALQTTETVNGTLTIDGVSEPLNTFSTSYLNLSYSPLAYSTEGSYCEAVLPIVYPVTASAGQTGDLGNFNCYTDSSKTVFIGTETEKYVTSAGSTYNTLDVKIITNMYDPSNNPAGSGSLTYTVTSEGIPRLTQFAMTATESGITINITAQ